MPKFLDVPSWYTSDWSLVSSWKDKPGFAEILKGNSDGTCKWEYPAVSMCNNKTNGSAVIYAPQNAGTSGQILMSTGGVPVWGEIPLPAYWTKNREVTHPSGYALSTLFTFTGSEKYNVNMALLISSSSIKMNETGTGSSTTAVGSRVLVIYIKNGIKSITGTYEDSYFGINLQNLNSFNCRDTTTFFPQSVTNASYSIFRMFS